MALEQRAFVFLLLQTLAALSTTERDYNLSVTYHNSEFSRFNHFKPWENRQLAGYVVERLSSPSLLSCAQQCLMAAWCTSTNFKLYSRVYSKGSCELNRHDISVVKENVNFVHQDGAIFSLLLKECPQGWHRHGSSCYVIHDTPTTNWSDALAFCQNHDAHLPIIKSADENDFIFRLIMSHSNVRNGGAWIGLNRIKDNEFYWMDDTPLAGQFTAWAQGEPNCLSEKCAFIFTKGDRQNQWHDSPCIFHGATGFSVPVVLCQKSIS